MRTILLYGLMVISGSYISCKQKQNVTAGSIQVTALVDITDQRAVLPDAETLLSFYDFAKGRDKEAFFRLTTTTDKLFNPASEYHLPSDEVTERDNQFDDPEFRQKQVLSFYTSVRKSIAAFNVAAKRDTTLSNSECFRSIASELAGMKANKATKSILTVYSELGENSALYKAYGSKVIEQLLNHPNTIISRFEATGLLPKDLSGFTVLFIFQPRNKQEDTLFYGMSRLYKIMLTQRGAAVVIRADNPKYIQI